MKIQRLLLLLLPITESFVTPLSPNLRARRASYGYSLLDIKMALFRMTGHRSREYFEILTILRERPRSCGLTKLPATSSIFSNFHSPLKPVAADRSEWSCSEHSTRSWRYSSQTVERCKYVFARWCHIAIYMVNENLGGWCFTDGWYSAIDVFITWKLNQWCNSWLRKTYYLRNVTW